MNDAFRLASFVLALVAVSLVAALLQPEYAHDLSLERWFQDVPLLAVQRKNAELTKANQLAFSEAERKWLAVQRLLNGRATLFEAAAAYLRLSRENGLRTFHQQKHSYSEEEWACHQVITWVRTGASEETARWLVPRLEEELRQYKEQYGTVTLPDEEMGTLQ